VAFARCPEGVAEWAAQSDEATIAAANMGILRNDNTYR
jgi:hypothetical protein